MTEQELINKAGRGVIGINETLEVFGGFDDQFLTAGATATKPSWVDAEDWDALSKEEKHKLADRMVALWQRYKEDAL